MRACHLVLLSALASTLPNIQDSLGNGAINGLKIEDVQVSREASKVVTRILLKDQSGSIHKASARVAHIINHRPSYHHPTYLFIWEDISARYRLTIFYGGRHTETIGKTKYRRTRLESTVKILLTVIPKDAHASS